MTNRINARDMSKEAQKMLIDSAEPNTAIRTKGATIYISPDKKGKTIGGLQIDAETDDAQD